MVTIEREIDIEASPSAVWDIVSTLGEYAEWNPFLVEGDGSFETGGRVRLTMRPGRRTMAFSPRIVAVEAGRSVRWIGRLGVPGVFDGEHVMEVQPLAGGRTRFSQREHFSGILVPFVGTILRDTEAGFGAMNAALKARAELVA